MLELKLIEKYVDKTLSTVQRILRSKLSKQIPVPKNVQFTLETRIQRKHGLPRSEHRRNWRHLSKFAVIGAKKLLIVV